MKKLFLTVIAVTLLFTLAACGGAPGPEPAQNGAASASPSEAVQATQSAPPASPSAAPEGDQAAGTFSFTRDLLVAQIDAALEKNSHTAISGTAQDIGAQTVNGAGGYNGCLYTLGDGALMTIVYEPSTGNVAKVTFAVDGKTASEDTMWNYAAATGAAMAYADPDKFSELLELLHVNNTTEDATASAQGEYGFYDYSVEDGTITLDISRLA
jgi:predicted small lipoprotein YifL